MSKYSLQAKIEFMVEMIENMEAITQRHGGIVKALEDFEGQMALAKNLTMRQSSAMVSKKTETVLTTQETTLFMITKVSIWA